MRVGIGAGNRLQLSFDELMSLGRPAADLGFDSLWSPRRTMPDAFHLCARWAQDSADSHGGKMRIGTAVLPAPQLWHPGTLASQAATVGAISNGRFVLGIGTGGYGADFWTGLGLPNLPIAIMRDYVEAMREAFRGEKVEYTGKAVGLHDYVLDRTPPKVPIYLAALGPQMMRLAGSTADGVILNGTTPEGVATSAAWLREGAERVGRERSDVSMAMNVRCCVDDDEDAARRAIASELLIKIAPSGRRANVDGALGYRGQFVRLGFEKEIVHIEQRVLAGATTSELIDDVPDELCNSAAYFGKPEGAAKRLAELSEGLDELIIQIVAARPGLEQVLRTMEAVTPEKVLAAL